MSEKRNTDYKDAGVDIDNANLFVERLRPLVKTTFRREVMGNIGGYGGLFHLDLARIKDPVLVASTDGVGTKLKIAQMLNKHDTIGIDLVAMSVNDVIVQGAEPLFFLDYLATGKIEVETSVQILEGIVNGCQEAGCALIGGETAEMPGLYGPGEYDLAGFCVGIVEAGALIDGSGISVGDRVIGLASHGLHSNGFSLVRKVLLEGAGLNPSEPVDELEHTLGEELIRPTKIYVRSILNIIKNFTVKGLAHITGGGFLDNLPRILPSPCRAAIQKGSWPLPPIFTLLQERGNIDAMEMFRVFNMGIGMIVVVSEKEVADILDRLRSLGERAYLIGTVEKRGNQQEQVVLN
ncbi:MAG: phosphoribosylformylglycinamidine cyclo-ligase [Syntrophales bacterium]